MHIGYTVILNESELNALSDEVRSALINHSTRQPFDRGRIMYVSLDYQDGSVWENTILPELRKFARK
jgi:hypothetical protein